MKKARVAGPIVVLLFGLAAVGGGLAVLAAQPVLGPDPDVRESAPVAQAVPQPDEETSVLLQPLEEPRQRDALEQQGVAAEPAVGPQAPLDGDSAPDSEQGALEVAAIDRQGGSSSPDLLAEPAPLLSGRERLLADRDSAGEPAHASATIAVAITITSEDDRLLASGLGIVAQKDGTVIAHVTADVLDQLTTLDLRWTTLELPKARSESGGWQVIFTEHTITARVTANTHEHLSLARSLGILDIQATDSPTVVDADSNTIETLEQAGLDVQLLGGRIGKVVARETQGEQEEPDSPASNAAGDAPHLAWPEEATRASCYGGCDCCWPLPDKCIPDLGYGYAKVNVTCAPSCAKITDVYVEVKLQDPGLLGGCDDTEMWCSDHLIEVNNEQHSLGDGYEIWDHCGTPSNPSCFCGETDWGCDHDTADDRDIELYQSITSFFDGDNANQWWYLDVWDDAEDDTAEIDSFKIWVYYDTRADLYDDGEAYRWFSPNPVCEGDAFEIHTDIRNGGCTDSGGFWVDFFASTNTYCSTSDCLIGWKYMTNVAAGDWENCDWYGNFPTCAPADDYWICWLIDSLDYVDESDETNNQAYKEGYQLTVDSCCECGDGVCDPDCGEDTCTCWEDCGSSCGDGCCNGSENTCNCCSDCGSSCGDGCCNCGEDSCSCCGDCGAVCGDGCCNCGENPCACASDCDGCCYDSDCDDGEVCTTDTCVSYSCQYSDNSLPCDDGLYCNGADTCSGGFCSQHSGDPCAASCKDGDIDCSECCRETQDDCNGNDPDGSACAGDGNECTDDECSGGECTHPCLPDGTPCPGDTCQDCVCGGNGCSQQPYTIGGAIFDDCTDPIGSGVAGVTVEVVCSDGFTGSTTSVGPQGLWSIPGVPCETCTVTVAGFCYVESTCPPDPCNDSVTIPVDDVHMAENQSLSFYPGGCVVYDMNCDGIISIISDVPCFVSCVYFGDCACCDSCPGEDWCTCACDCSGDDICSILFDVPCFVACVYFGNCIDGRGAGPSRVAGQLDGFTIGGAAYDDELDPLTTGVEGILVEVLGAEGGVVASTTTEGPIGLWRVDALPEGQYTVMFGGQTFRTIVVNAENQAANQSIKWLRTGHQVPPAEMPQAAPILIERRRSE